MIEFKSTSRKGYHVDRHENDEQRRAFRITFINRRLKPTLVNTINRAMLSEIENFFEENK